jgi:hypothetical protein
MKQRPAVMPRAAFAAPAMSACDGDHGPIFAITYEWDGGDLGLTAKRPTRRLGRLST